MTIGCGQSQKKPILIWQGKNQRILEFTYDEDVVFRLRDHAYAETNCILKDRDRGGDGHVVLLPVLYE